MGLEEGRKVFEEIKPSYRELEEMLKGRKGHQVLVINEKIERGDEDDCFSSSKYTKIESTLRLGVLNSDIRFEIGDGKKNPWMLGLSYSKANLTGPRIILPTERYAEKREGGVSPETWNLVEGNIEISSSEFHDFDPEGERIKLSKSLVLGNYGRGSLRLKRTLLIKFGEDVVGCFKSDDSLYNNDFSYVKALDLLGIKDRAPSEFLIEYNREIGKAKRCVVTGLIELLEQQDISKSRIRTIYDSTKKGGMHEGGAITVIENQEDARAVSMGTRQKLREIEQNIVRRLKAAVRLGMHDEELILDGEIPGQSLNTRTLIRTLCEQYKVSH